MSDMLARRRARCRACPLRVLGGLKSGGRDAQGRNAAYLLGCCPAENSHGQTCEEVSGRESCPPRAVAQIPEKLDRKRAA